MAVDGTPTDVGSRRRRAMRRLWATVVAIAALAAPHAWAQSCRIEVEPNDSPADATRLGEARCFVGELDDEQDAFVWEVGAADADTPWVVEMEGIAGQSTRLELFEIAFADDGVGVTAAERTWEVRNVDGRVVVAGPVLFGEGLIHFGLSKSGGSGPYVVHLRPQRALSRDYAELARVTSAAGPLDAHGPLSPGAPHEIAWTLDEDEAGYLWGIEGQVAVGGSARVTLDGPAGHVGASDLTVEGGAALAYLGLAAGAYRLTIEGDAGMVALRTVRQGRPTEGYEVESNDDLDAANLMPIERPFEGAAEGRDWIAVDVPAASAGQAFDLVVEAGGDLTVALADAAGNVLQSRSGSAGRLRGLVLGAGRHHLLVEGRGAIAYRLAFEPVAAPVAGFEVEPNDVFGAASPMTDELTLRGTLDPQDRDVLSFTVDGEPGLWRVQAVGAGLRSVESFDGGRSSQGTAEGDGRLRLDNLLLAPGTQYLELRGEGDYAVRALRLGPAPAAPPPAPVASPPPLVADDAATEAAPEVEADDPARLEVSADPGPPPPAGWLESEPNEASVRAAPLPVGVTRVGTLPGDDRDRYRFTLDHDAYVRIEAMPPADGRVAFDTTSANRALAAETGAPAVLERWLLAGAYEVSLWADQPSDGYYQLRMTLPDPIALPVDLEPNDGPETASRLPADLVVVGHAGEMRDDDVYVLPVFSVDTEMRIEAELDGPNVTLFAAARLERDGDGVYRADLAAGERAHVRLRGRGSYRLAFTFGTPPDPGQLRPPAGDPGVAVGATPARAEVAAYAPAGQVVRGQLDLHNTAPGPRTLTFESASSLLPVRIDLPGELTLADGERRTVPFEIVLPDDLRDDQPLRITLAARSELGVATVPLVFDARCEVDPVAPVRHLAVPAALLGHLDVAWAPFGAVVVDSDSPNDAYLNDGFTSPGRGAGRMPGESFVLDLPGDDPIRLTGTLLHPQSRGVAEQLRRFAVEASLDGATFVPVLEGRLEAAREEQGLAFDEPVEARFVRLRVIDDHDERGENSAWVGEWKVLTDEPGVVGAIDLADPELGGVMVWSDPLLPVNSVLPGAPTHASLDGRRIDEAVWVLGFQHGRAAQVERIVWVESERAEPDERFERVRVEASLAGPVGPWEELGEWALERDAAGAAELGLAAPAWARYLRFTASGHDAAQTSVYTPEAIHVVERATDDSYRTVLAEWGHYRSTGPYEASLGTLPPTAPLAEDDGSDDARDGARTVGDGDVVRGSVLVAEDEDWYRIDVPAGANLLELTLDAAAGTVRHELTDADGRPVTHELTVVEDTVSLRAFVSPGTYYLRLDEPKRSVVFSWDTSGSVGPFLPITYASVGSFARDLDPEREVAQLLAFDDPTPAWILPYWSGDPNHVSRSLSEFDPSTVDSSQAELALLEAVRALGDREGTRAVLFITDHESGSYALTPALWRALEAVRPRVFTFEVSSGGSGITQDRMQAYAAVNGGLYDYARDVGDFDTGFRRASCLLRRPKAYTLSVAVRSETPPGPGQLAVVRAAGAEDEQPALQVVFDASGSMGAPLPDGTPRIVAAREVLNELVDEILPEGMPFALRAYGHVQPTSCDTRLELPLGPLDRAAAGRAIAAIEPKLLSGTPLAAAVEAVAGDLAAAAGPKTVVLITDGEESCGGDVDAAIRSLVADPDVRLSIVGFALAPDVAAAAGDRFTGWAALGGGSYVEALDRDGLAAAVEVSLRPPELRFEVLDAAGGVVADGVVGGEAVPLPAGVYRVRVDGGQNRISDALTVRFERQTTLVWDPAD